MVAYVLAAILTERFPQGFYRSCTVRESFTSILYQHNLKFSSNPPYISQIKDLQFFFNDENEPHIYAPPEFEIERKGILKNFIIENKLLPCNDKAPFVPFNST